MEQLYEKGKLNSGWSGKKETKDLNADEQSVTHELCHSAKCGKISCCVKGDRTDKWFEAGRLTLMQELNVKHLIRNMRVFEKFI